MSDVQPSHLILTRPGLRPGPRLGRSRGPVRPLGEQRPAARNEYRILVAGRISG